MLLALKICCKQDNYVIDKSGLRRRLMSQDSWRSGSDVRVRHEETLGS